MTKAVSRLLQAIWAGEAKPAEAHGASTLRRILEEIFPFRMVILEVAKAPATGRVLTDETELMPGLPLGDVLAEECDLIVPAGTCIICCTADEMAESCEGVRRSEVLGQICAEIIVDAVQFGNYQLEREPEAMYRLSEAVTAAACDIAEATDQIDADRFGRALARGLRATLEGPAAARKPFGRGLNGYFRLSDTVARMETYDFLAAGEPDCTYQAWTDGAAATMRDMFPALTPEAERGDQESHARKV